MIQIFTSILAAILSLFSGKPTRETIYISSPSIQPEIIVEEERLFPSMAPSMIPSKFKVQATPTDNEPWGIAKQVGEHTWTMKVEQDGVMASPKEIMDALNEYRRNKGVAVLMWDEKLANYAQSRAEFFERNQGLDSHQGFEDFLDNQDGFNKIGFTYLGENASFGYRLNGVHLIEWIYAGDEPHNKNQLNKDWAYLGVGVKGTASCLIFGTGKM